MVLIELNLCVLLIVNLFINPGMPEQVVCSNSVFGSPSLVPCRNLLQALPSSVDEQIRLFDEEQLRNNGHRWPGSANPFPAPIVQVPKYWSNGQFSCTL